MHVCLCVCFTIAGEISVANAPISRYNEAIWIWENHFQFIWNANGPKPSAALNIDASVED